MKNSTKAIEEMIEENIELMELMGLNSVISEKGGDKVEVKKGGVVYVNGELYTRNDL